MAGERSYAVLMYADLDSTLDFYRALGFAVTFEQRRPYPCAVVALNDLQFHLAVIDGFDPAGSYGSVIITVPDLEDFYSQFRAGLKQDFGRIPIAGIPRILPIRSKAGTATGFTIVDTGGNWLRFYRTGASEDSEEARTGLGRVVEVAARQGDSRGDDKQAIAVLDAGLLRYPDAPPEERFDAVLYRAELKGRIGADWREDLATATSLAEQSSNPAMLEELARVAESLDP